MTVQQDDETVTVYFASGEIVDVALGDQVGEEAIYRVLKWEEGEFVMESGIASPEQTIVTPWSALLMGGLQQVDEERWDDADELT